MARRLGSHPLGAASLPAAGGTTREGTQAPGEGEKYRHTDDPMLTWAACRRKPGWLVDALESGTDPDFYAV
ncbi:MAG: hypothetical protein OXC54_09355 [Rhodospirillaceae bacterium]|nr:hypothetical protein [Rhodospirillaceae bacterium]MCY4311498.1 hypothetical protein [Rhodospirillaceae bacterium]